jgi:predicted CoA-binding protein
VATLLQLNLYKQKLLVLGMGSNQKKTLVLGASANPARYSYLAINRLRNHNHPVVAIGRKTEKVFDVEVDTEKKPFDDVDTVTLYLNPKNQEQYYDYILSLNPRRIIFNPGTENDELVRLAHQKGIQTTEGCTLVMLSTGQY